MAILFALCFFPFANLFYKVIVPKGQLSFEYLIATVKHPGARKAFANTLLVSLAISCLSTVIAVPVGWLLTRTDLPWNRSLRTWYCLPYAIPPYIGAMAWIYLANPATGLLNRLFAEPILNVYSYFGLIWIESSFLYTFLLLAVFNSLDRMDSSLEEAARLSGASPFMVFRKITLPLLKPALVSGWVLVFLASAASFGVPALIGSPARIYLVTTQIYTFQKMGTIKGLFQGISLSLILLCFALALLAFNQWILRGTQYKIVSGKSARSSVIELRSWRWPLFGLLLIVLFVLFVLPLGGILITALTKVHGQSGLGNFGFGNFRYVFLELTETWRALGNSLKLAFFAATAAVLLSFFLAYLQWKTKIRGRQLLDLLASFPYSIPGTVVALALILAFSNGIFGLGPSLYNTLALLWLAYLIKFLSLSIKTIGDGFGQIDDSLAEAARISGASWLGTIWSIWIPLLKPAIVASWFLIFMPAFSELTMTILLSGPGMETLGTLIFQLQEYADPSGGSAAVLAILVIVLVIVINQIVKTISQGKYGL